MPFKSKYNAFRPFDVADDVNIILHAMASLSLIVIVDFINWPLPMAGIIALMISTTMLVTQ